MPLSSEEIQRRRALISKLKEETMSHEEALELICLLEKEKRIIFEEEGDCMLVLAICNIVSYFICPRIFRQPLTIKQERIIF
jgi:hypothetical protein